jgi:hypothetical protein
MTPFKIKKLLSSVITELKVKKEWNTSPVSTYKSDIDNKSISISFMHDNKDEKTNNSYFTIHSNYLGVWFGTFKILKNGSVSIRSLHLVMDADKLKEMSNLEKLQNLVDKSTIDPNMRLSINESNLVA